MTIQSDNPSQTFFDRMNLVFWAIWALFPFTLGVAIYFLANQKDALEGFSEAQIKCLGDKLAFGQGSMATGIAITLLVLYEIGFYVLLFALLHRMIRNFQKGAIFVGKTLDRVQTLGWLIVSFPIVEQLLHFVANLVLRKLGAPTVESNPYVDLAPIAVGLFLIALRHVLHHAMQMKSENDLTI